MIKPLLAATSLVAALHAPAPDTLAQEQTICQSEQVGCSSGPQLCATVELRVEIIAGVPTTIPINCWQTT